MRQHRSGCLLQDLSLGQRCAFRCEISILDAPSGGLRVDDNVGQVVNRVVETVNNCTQISTFTTQRFQRAINCRNRVLATSIR